MNLCWLMLLGRDRYKRQINLNLNENTMFM